MVGKIFLKTAKRLAPHIPAILTIAGCAGTVVGAVVASKETLTVEPVIDECKDIIDAADEKKDIVKAYAKAGKLVVRHYAPTIVIFTVSIGSILAGHHIIRKRHLALISAYSSLDASYKGYRKRVVNKYGKDADTALYHDIQKEKIKNPSTGKLEEAWVMYPHDHDDTSRFFQAGCINWTKDPEANLLYLKGQEELANAIFDEQGYLLLNDVYAMIGVEPTDQGACVGWVKGFGDDFVDFGIIRVENADAVNGWEPVFLLDFNHDGYILDKI